MVQVQYQKVYHMFYHMKAVSDRSGDCSGDGFRLIQVGLKILYNLLREIPH